MAYTLQNNAYKILLKSLWKDKSALPERIHLELPPCVKCKCKCKSRWNGGKCITKNIRLNLVLLHCWSFAFLILKGFKLLWTLNGLTPP